MENNFVLGDVGHVKVALTDCPITFRAFGSVKLMAKRNRGNAPTRYSIVRKGDDYVFVCNDSPNGLPFYLTDLRPCDIGKTEIFE